MKRIDLHPKVALWYTDWLAIQLVRMPEISLGIRVESRRRFVDFYFGPLTVAVGKHPVLTDARLKHSDSCRGFVFTDSELARVL